MGSQNSVQSSRKICPRDFSINACPRDLGSTNKDVKECAHTTENLSTRDQYVESRYLAVEEVAFMYLSCSSLAADCDIDSFQNLIERGIWGGDLRNWRTQKAVDIRDAVLRAAEEKREGLTRM